MTHCSFVVALLGRDDAHADVILLASFTDAFRQSSMVFTERTGLEKLYGMLAYAFDVKHCRRSLIAQHFGETYDMATCNDMCDHCSAPCTGTRTCTCAAHNIQTFVNHMC